MAAFYLYDSSHLLQSNMLNCLLELRHNGGKPAITESLNASSLLSQVNCMQATNTQLILHYNKDHSPNIVPLTELSLQLKNCVSSSSIN